MIFEHVKTNIEKYKSLLFHNPHFDLCLYKTIKHKHCIPTFSKHIKYYKHKYKERFLLFSCEFNTQAQLKLYLIFFSNSSLKWEKYEV